MGLREADELDIEIQKVDFGTWLHGVLRRYHESEPASAQGRMAALDDAAKAQSKAMGLSEDEFLPFAASWPQVRDGYLHWLAQHANSRRTLPRQKATIGLNWAVSRCVWANRPDRPPARAGGPGDRLQDRGAGRNRRRVKTPTEDTQLAFYSALLENNILQAAYVESGGRNDHGLAGRHPGCAGCAG